MDLHLCGDKENTSKAFAGNEFPMVDVSMLGDKFSQFFVSESVGDLGGGDASAHLVWDKGSIGKGEGIGESDCRHGVAKNNVRCV